MAKECTTSESGSGLRSESGLGQLQYHHAAFDVEGGARVSGRFLQRLAQHVLLVRAVLEPTQNAVPGAVADGEGELEAAALHRDLSAVFERELDSLHVGVGVVDADARTVVLDGGEELLRVLVLRPERDFESWHHPVPPGTFGCGRGSTRSSRRG